MQSFDTLTRNLMPCLVFLVHPYRSLRVSNIPATMAENIALWTLLCILVVLILVISADLLASCGRQKGGLTTAAVGGGLALSWGCRALSQAHRAPPLLGGGISDIYNDTQKLNFPPDQAAAEKEHQVLRQQVKKVMIAYEKARGAKLSQLPKNIGSTERPAKGWPATDALATNVKNGFIWMCEAMRGEFPSGAVAVADGPWNNSKWPGPKTRMSSWEGGYRLLYKAISLLPPMLVTVSGGNLLPVKKDVEAIIPLLRACKPPVISSPPPIALVPLSVIAASTHHSDSALQNVHGILQLALDTYCNDNLSTSADLRAGKEKSADPGSCINVAKCDALASQAVNEFNALTNLYLTTIVPHTHENVKDAITAGRKLIGSLTGWASEIDFGALGTTGTLQASYNTLKGNIANAQVAVNNLDLPPLPDPPDLATLTMVDDRTHPKAIVVAGTDNRIENLRAWITHVLSFNIGTGSVGARPGILRVRRPDTSNLRSCKTFNAAGTVISTATIATGLYIDVKAADAAVTKVIGEFNKLAICYAAGTADTLLNITAVVTGRKDLHHSLTEWANVISARSSGSPLEIEYGRLLIDIGGPADDYTLSTVQAAVNGLIIPPLPASPNPATLTVVDATTHDKAGAISGSNLLEDLRNMLFNISTTYDKPGLRGGTMTYSVSTMPYFDIVVTDQLVADIITSFNTLAQYYATGRPKAYKDLQDTRIEINKLQGVLTKWAINIEGAAVAAKADTRMLFEYNSLAYSIGGTGVSTSNPSSARHRAGILTLPEPPSFPDPSIISVPGPSSKFSGPTFANFTNLYNELVNTVTTYGKSDLAITDDLRRGEPGPKRDPAVDYLGPYFDVEQSDKHANEVITAFNNLNVLYQDAPPSTPRDGVAFSKEIADAKAALTAWTKELAAAAAAPEPLKTGYQALIASVGTLQAGFNTLAPPVPNYKYTRTAKPLAKVDQPKNINDPVIHTSGNLNLLLALYNQCCASYLLDWNANGPAIKAVDDAFDVLQDSYDVTPRNIAAARQTAINKKILVAALTSLQAATKVDPTFARALSLTNPIADGLDKGLAVLIGDVSKHVLTGATLSDGGIISGMKIRDHTRLKALADPSKYPKYFMKDIGVKCENLIGNTIMDTKTKKKSILTPGLRTQIKTLWTAFRIDPVAAEKDLFQIESDVETMATISLKCAMTGDPTLIPSGEAVKKTLLKNLAHLEAKVQAEPLLEDALHTNNAKYKKDFTAAIKKVSDALNAIILIWGPPPPGLMRGASAPTRSPPLPDSMRLIHYEYPPTETLGGIFQNVSEIPAGLRTDVIIEVRGEKDLASMAARLPKSGPRRVYGLVVHHPGDMTALYKAIAICLKQAPPLAIAAKNANRKQAATGWLYDIVRFESGAHYIRLHEYIKPELYAIDT